ncbi:hypothetical protein IMSAGC019_02926 [Lachnospiraceae bacterium]|nr:hypothetical protein IMSAGC019_02926 [Lachnospiraceae bacterium]
MRTLISGAVKSFGCTARSASTFAENSGYSSAAFFAFSSFLRTSPERYSSAVCQPLCQSVFSSEITAGPLSGSLKIMPFKSEMIWGILSPPPIRDAINPRSTQALSPIETPSASTAVSTLVTGWRCWIVRFVNISALRFKFPSSSSTSKEHNSG